MTEITEHDVVAAIAAEGGVARLLGGRAVAALCGAALPPALRRHSADIDLVARGRDRKALRAAIEKLGGTPEREFNLLNGKERMIFHAGNIKIDIFFDVFRMCHKLVLGHRLDLHPLTLPPADLLLTKLQVVHAERKDLSDTAALLLCCDLGNAGPTTIDTGYLARIVGADWGLWRTASGTLKTLRESTAEICGASELAQALARHVDALLHVFEMAPRSVSWRMRAVIGERSVWYELPEEPVTDHLPATA